MNAGELDSRTLGAVLVLAVVVLTALALGMLVPGVSTPVEQEHSTETHQDPATAGGDEQLGQLEQQLASELQQQVQSGAINLSREDVDEAREQFDDDRYDQLIDDYGDVASGEDAEQQQQLLQQARQSQRQYADLVGEYWTLFEEYEELDNATDERERETARELDRLSRNITDTGEETLELYEELETRSGDNYTDAITSITDSNENVTAEQQQIREEQFIETTLTLATAEPAAISPTDPLAVRGQITAVNQSTLSNESVTLDIGEQQLETATNETGWFETEYHPTLVPANSSSLTVGYEPANESIYLGGETEQNVTIDRGTPTLDVDATPSTVSYDSNVSVTGDVSVGDHGVGEVPFAVRADGEILEQNETRADGTINETVSIPASLDSGEQSLTVELLLSEQALRSSNESTSVTVSQSETALAVSAEPTDDGTVLVSGMATAADDTPIEDQPLELSLNGTAVGTVRTASDGSFEQQVVVPDAVADDIDEAGVAEVTVDFDGAGTNLDGTTASTQTEITLASDGVSLSVWLFAPVGVAILLAAAYVLATRTRRESAAADETQSKKRRQPAHSVSSLDHAKTLLESDRPAAAIQASYGALRQELTAGNRDSSTHWELYRSHRETLDAEREQLLREVTEGYERAAFAPTGVDRTTARQVVDAVETFSHTER